MEFDLEKHKQEVRQTLREMSATAEAGRRRAERRFLILELTVCIVCAASIIFGFWLISR